ncbi:MAG: hypothetical protein ABI024_00795 [Vicinamibacterales bacterium]
MRTGVAWGDTGKPTDYCFLEVNAAFIKMTGWPDAVGTRMRELAPHHEEHWFEIYGKGRSHRVADSLRAEGGRDHVFGRARSYARR